MPIKNVTAPSAETIIRGAKIATLDARNTVVSAIAIRDGKVQATGSDGEIEAYSGPQTKVIDARGRTVIPGL
jgi:predicted amidohydrolase YtcJ